jgi:radical SAM protein with 4Fe4S-binding SPASM domain
MCHIWKYPTAIDQEFSARILHKLPHLHFVNITGGEPFLRKDISDIIAIMKKKSPRIVISTNGFLTDRIVEVMRDHKDVGVRVSIEGMPQTNDLLRGKEHCFDHGLTTLMELKKMGCKDLGFAITVSDSNAHEMINLYRTAAVYGFEFATAVVHNSYYFHKHDNRITKQEVISAFVELINELLHTSWPKNWYRAYFNYGLVNHIQRKPRLLPCGAGADIFFLDPFGEIRPCNGMQSESSENSMGNLSEKSFDDIWNSARAKTVRDRVKSCSRNCWMVGTVAPAIKRNIATPTAWVLNHKLRSLLGKQFVL